MSTTYPAWALTNYPDALDKSNSNVRQTIVNFEDRTSSTDPLLYYVLSNDVKALQQAMFSIQESLGTIPQTTFGTVGARIAALEDYTDLDARYGGSAWGAIEPAENRPTIMGHLHDGTGTGAAKIILDTHTTGTLNKANINLVRTDGGGLTGDDIAISASSDVKISAQFATKLNTTGGTIQGTGALLTVNAPFNSRIYKEADAYLCVPASDATGANVSDSDAFSGTARKALSSNATGNLIHYTAPLRYGDYSLGLRAKVSSISPLESMGKVRIYSGSTLTKEVDLIPADFASTSYQMFYVAFSHAGNATVNVYIQWYGTSVVPAVASDLTVDSLVITPMHIAAPDKD